MSSAPSTSAPSATNERSVLLQGNEACALGAIAAGCRFYAGYPITPSSEIAERMARELPLINGVFVQMEDEIASMAAVLGASMGGAKAMTATSGPGFSLMQEHVGYAAGVEVPCVIADVMRGGPSTGMPTRPAQGDVMQARWGTHGDHAKIVLTPASVSEIYTETIRAFNLSEALRCPVVVLYDEAIGHLTETVELARPDEIELIDRRWADGPTEGFLPYATDDDAVPAMARPGDGYRVHTTGLTHGDNGFPTQDPLQVDRAQRRVLGKLDRHRAVIDRHETLHLDGTDDVDVLVVAYGITARAAQMAVSQARAAGVRAGLFRPITMWPFPVETFALLAGRSTSVLVPEMNAGQLVQELQRHVDAGTVIEGLNRFDGEVIEPAQILDHILELHAHGSEGARS